MSAPQSAPVKVHLLLSLLMRVGVLVCAAVLAAGWIGNLARPPADSTTIAVLRSGGILPEGTVTNSLAEVVSGLARGSPRAVIVTGLMLLIALPIVRVAMTAVSFAQERDVLYVALSLVVLALLLSGLLLGRAV
jgi:uncharacterized membrane protein